MKSLTLKPRLSEKSYALSEQLNIYTFDIPNGYNKQSVIEAVKANFNVNVKVKAVRLAAVQGKSQRSYRRGGRIVHKGRRSDIRKAYVTLEKGEKLPIYAAVDEPKAVAKEKK